MSLLRVTNSHDHVVAAVPMEIRSLRRRRWSALFVALSVVFGVFAGMPAASADLGDVGYEGPSHTGTGTPTGTKRAESVLWYNDGTWWANMWDTSTNDFYIFKWSTSSTTWGKTSTRVDTRSNTHVDALWDGSKLYIASHTFVADGVAAVSGYPSYLYQYSYNSTTKTYTLDAGFPAQINNMKTETLTIDKDSTGILWATWMQGNRIYYNRTSDSTHKTWTTPKPVPNAQDVSVDDTSSLIAYNGYVGILWSSQHATAPDGVYFSVHKDGAADTAWSSTPIVAYQAPNGSDDHMNLKWLDASGGQIYAAVKTSFTTGSQALLQLLVFDVATGKWRAPYTIAKQSECPNRVILLIDESKGLLRTFATYPGPDGVCSTSGGAIYEKSSPLNNISFPASKGSPVINDNSDQVVHNSTSTKQNIKAGMGVVVLADNNRTSRYWTFYEPAAGTTPAPTASFTATPTTGTAPLAVQFTDTSTGSPTSRSWDFGDGSAVDATANPSHTFTNTTTSPVTRTVTLTVTNSGGSNSTTKTITVNPSTTTPPPTGSGIVRGGSSTVPTSTAAATVTVPLPSGTAAGDVLVSCLSLNGGTVKTAPAGWTQIAAVTSISNPHVYGYYKVAAAGEATPTWTLSGSLTSGAGITRYTGASGVDGPATTATGAAATSGTVPAVTTTTANTMVVGCMGVNSSSTAITSPSGMTEAWEVAGKKGELDDGLQASAGSTGARTWTFAASREWAGWLVALRAK
jgi:PKD repeat protein